MIGFSERLPRCVFRREQRLEIGELGKGFYTIRVRYGFTDEANILRALAQCRVGGFRFNLMETSFIIGREKLRLRPRQRKYFNGTSSIVMNAYAMPLLCPAAAWRGGCGIYRIIPGYCLAGKRRGEDSAIHDATPTL